MFAASTPSFLVGNDGSGRATSVSPRSQEVCRLIDAPDMSVRAFAAIFVSVSDDTV